MSSERVDEVDFITRGQTIHVRAVVTAAIAIVYYIVSHHLPPPTHTHQQARVLEVDFVNFQVQLTTSANNLSSAGCVLRTASSQDMTRLMCVCIQSVGARAHSTAAATGHVSRRLTGAVDRHVNA
jgi:hypothetical protein